MWRTIAFKYELWSFLLWLIFHLSCQNNHSQPWLLLDPSMLLLLDGREGAEHALCMSLTYCYTSQFGSSNQRNWKRNNEEKMTDLWLPGSIAFSFSPAWQGKLMAFARVQSFMGMSSVLGWDSQGLFSLPWEHQTHQPCLGTADQCTGYQKAAHSVLVQNVTGFVLFSDKTVCFSNEIN